MTLALLIPGVGMGASDGGSPTPAVLMQAVHLKRGVWQPNVPTITGPGTGG